MRHLVTLVLALALAGVLTPTTATGAGTAATATPLVSTLLSTATSPAPAHLIVNRKGSNAPRALGYNIFDTSASTSVINALPRGVRALVWLGQKCPTRIDDAFRATVRKLAANPRVYGYYLSDEPHVADCPGGPAALRSRAAFIAAASGGRQVSFVVLSRRADYRAFRPAVTGVTLLGVNAYPCSTSNPGCDLSKIRTKVYYAVTAGIPRGRIVPVLQTFGQERTSGGGYYRMPTATQLRGILAEWRRWVPAARMDYSYGWGHQSSANPTLVDSPTLQDVMKRYFGA